MIFLKLKIKVKQICFYTTCHKITNFSLVLAVRESDYKIFRFQCPHKKKKINFFFVGSKSPKMVFTCYVIRSLVEFLAQKLDKNFHRLFLLFGLHNLAVAVSARSQTNTLKMQSFKVNWKIYIGLPASEKSVLQNNIANKNRDKNKGENNLLFFLPIVIFVYHLIQNRF